MPMGADAERLRPHAERRRALAKQQGRVPLEIVALGGLSLDDPPCAGEQRAALAELGVSRVAHSARYADAAVFGSIPEKLAALRG